MASSRSCSKSSGPDHRQQPYQGELRLVDPVVADTAGHHVGMAGYLLERNFAAAAGPGR